MEAHFEEQRRELDFDFQPFDRLDEFAEASDECESTCYEPVFSPRPFCPFHHIDAEETSDARQAREDREDAELVRKYVDNYPYGW